MIRFALSFICMITLSILLTGCAVNEDKAKNSPSPTPVEEKHPEPTQVPEKNIIKVWDYNGEMTAAIEKFKELHPDFEYDIKVEEKGLVCISYDVLLSEALAAGGEELPDIYPVESANIIRYTQGAESQYAATYKSLGIDVNSLLKEASIAKYAIDIGTNRDGELVGLNYQSTVSAFVYRRSIAKDVWGTDDPNIIKTKIGPGWDKFLVAAADLKAKEYRICSSFQDIWQAVLNSADKKWVEDDKLVFDVKREKLIDLAMELEKNDYTNHTESWSDEWYKDIKDEGANKVFGFMGPTWFVNYVLTENSAGSKVGEGTYGDWAVCEPPVDFFWGGTWLLANKDTKAKEGVAKLLTWLTVDTSETGYQYLLANGIITEGIKEAAISTRVMEKSVGNSDFLGGQNLFEVYIPAGEKVNGKNRTQYDETINYYWLEQVREYTRGNKSREEAIADFKKNASDYLVKEIK